MAETAAAALLCLWYFLSLLLCPVVSDHGRCETEIASVGLGPTVFSFIAFHCLAPIVGHPAQKTGSIAIVIEFQKCKKNQLLALPNCFLLKRNI